VTFPARFMGAAVVILDERGRVLLVKHTYGRLNWELPGGISEPGESVVETALREVGEETGLQAVAHGLAAIYYDRDRDVHQFLFRCRVDGESRPVPSSPEISECAYWPPDALPRPISDFTIRRIEDALLEAPQELLPISIPPRTWLE